MPLNLKRLENDITRIERQGINDNWTKIENNFNNVVEIVSDEALDKVVNAAKLIWKEPVDTYADLITTYPNAQEGWTSMARDTGDVYRYYQTTGWGLIQQIAVGPVNELDHRLTEQLSQKADEQEVTTDLAKKVDKTISVFNSLVSSESATLGPELLDGNGWTSVGWTGNFTNGFTHVVGQTSPLKRNILNLGTKILQIELTLTPTAVIDNGTSDFTVTLGGSAPFETYRGSFSTLRYNFGIRSAGLNEELVITPWANYNGVITNISAKEIVTPSLPMITYKDSSNATSLETRLTTSSLNNIFLGKNSGRYNISGDRNIALGHETLRDNTSGIWNSAIGDEALRDNTVGTRNIAIGRVALKENVSGDRNIAIGTFSLTRNKTGRGNIAIGADSLWYNTSGTHNVAVGLLALGGNTTGEYNIALGASSMGGGTGTGNHSVAIGNLALYYNRGDNNFAFGMRSMYRNTTGYNNGAIGYDSLFFNETGRSNFAFGNRTLYRNVDGSHNIALGHMALYNNLDSNNIALGYNAAYENTEGSDNIALGQNAFYKNQVGQRNIMLGRNTGTDTQGSYNTYIGVAAGSNAGNSGDNNILIGYGVQKMTSTASNQLNIGNVIRSRDMTTGVIEIPKLKLTLLSTSPPSESGMLWNDGGTLKIS